MAGSNSIQFRWAVKIQDGVQIDQRLQFRTKDITASVLNLIPLASTWSDWQDIEIDVTEVTVA